MRDDVILSETFRRQAGWWRLTPFIIALIVLLGMIALGSIVARPTGPVVVEGLDLQPPYP